MNRVQLVEAIAAEHELSKAAATRIIDSIMKHITTAVAKGDAVTLVGFGTFKKHHRNARKGFNPRSGEKIKIAAASVPKFVAGKKFKDAVASGRTRRK
jgi:DNA-binding protein HU-beta